jgi:serine/threonine protein kinase
MAETQGSSGGAEQQEQEQEQQRGHGPFAAQATKEALTSLKRFEDSSTYYRARAAADDDDDVVVETTSSSSSFVTQFQWDQIDIQSVLGEGAFSVVLKVSIHSDHFKQQPQQQVQRIQETPQNSVNRDSLTLATTSTCRTTTTSNTTTTPTVFALKCLKAKSIPTPESLVVAATDLAIEAELLARLKQENIITLRGMSMGAPSESYGGGGRDGGGGLGQFLVLDVLQETLLTRLNHWRRYGGMEDDCHRNNHIHVTKKRQRSKQQQPQPSQNVGVWCSLLLASCTATATAIHKAKQDMLNRIDVIVRSIVSAMAYLHDHHQIVLRDLKPENCGYDASTGQWKLFDFGLARPLQHLMNHKADVAGSIHYMAPEIMLGHGTTLASDVYSFGILLWELCTLQLPYESLQHLSRDELADQIAAAEPQCCRPPLSSWNLPSGTVRRLISDCWSADPCNRPTFSTIATRWSGVTSKTLVGGMPVVAGAASPPAAAAGRPPKSILPRLSSLAKRTLSSSSSLPSSSTMTTTTTTTTTTSASTTIKKNGAAAGTTERPVVALCTESPINSSVPQEKLSAWSALVVVSDEDDDGKADISPLIGKPLPDLPPLVHNNRAVALTTTTTTTGSPSSSWSSSSEGVLLQQ